MADSIRALIRTTEGWREAHVRAGRGIEALACGIRLKALRECLALAGERGGDYGA